MLRPLIAYARGAGVDARWLVIDGTPAFFRVTKRLHHALHGSTGDGSAPRRARSGAIYEASSTTTRTSCSRWCAAATSFCSRPADRGARADALRSGARVIWRCHIGTTSTTRRSSAAGPSSGRTSRTCPSRLLPQAVRARVARGRSPRHGAHDRCLLAEEPGDARRGRPRDPGPHRAHRGSAGRRAPDVRRARTGSPRGWTARPTSSGMGRATRWDAAAGGADLALGSPQGSDRRAARLRPGDLPGGARPARPRARGAERERGRRRPRGRGDVFDEVLAAWRALPHYDRTPDPPRAPADGRRRGERGDRQRAAAARDDRGPEEPRARASGSPSPRRCGRGGRWSRARSAASRTRSSTASTGCSCATPHDLDAFAGALRKLLGDPALRERLGKNAQARVREKFLGMRQLRDYGELLARADAAVAQKQRRPEPTFTPSPQPA